MLRMTYIYIGVELKYQKVQTFFIEKETGCKCHIKHFNSTVNTLLHNAYIINKIEVPLHII